MLSGGPSTNAFPLASLITAQLPSLPIIASIAHHDRYI